jgi:ribosome-binding protein aMBF1 (putative translation factor)
MPRRSRNLSEEHNIYERALAKTMGKRLRERRQQLGLSQEQVRNGLEVEQVHISRTQ